VAAGAGAAGGVLIRPLDVARDAEPAVAILCEADPSWVLTADGWRYWLEHVPERGELEQWAAVDDDEVVGVAGASRRWATRSGEAAFVRVTVRADRRKRGIGDALYRLAEAHARALGCARLMTYLPDTRHGRRFAEERGFRVARVAVDSTVDPRSVDSSSLDDLPAGIRVAPFSELAGRLDELFAVGLEAVQDEPQSDAVDDVRFEEWLEETWRQPMFGREGSFAALDGGRPVSSATIYVDRERRRARNGFTGTLRSHRGRGLATLAKLAVLRWAAGHGIDSLWTANDETNGPMLAVNRRLGYRPASRAVEMLRDL
jgi:GNAT superfamily N-acetyltransferase